MRQRNRLLPLLLFLVAGLLALSSCRPDYVTETSTAVPPPAAEVEPSAVPGQAQAPDQAPAAIPTEDLIAQVKASLPADAFGGLTALPLIVPPGSQPLWAVVSTGMLNFELDPVPSHFVAIYAQSDGWQELARLELNSQDGGPTFVHENASQQVHLDPSRIWLQIAGGMGAHGGSFQLVSFDGSTLRMEINAISPSPEMGKVEDIDGDGTLEVVLDVSDPYILCYACGARKVQFQVMVWDPEQEQLVERGLQPLADSAQADDAVSAANRAVTLAQAGLWRDALAQVEEARQSSAQLEPSAQATLNWDDALIRLHTDAMAKQPLTVQPDVSPIVPLLNNVFYGDYAAAVDLLREYEPEELFSAQSPLYTDPMIEGWLPDVSRHLTESATQALAAEPDLAAAHFIRGWGEYLADPAGPQAREDISRAAALAPEDALYQASQAVLQ